MTVQESTIYQYSDVFLAYLQNNDSICSFRNKCHSLKYVYSGEITLEENGNITQVHSGECVFIRRDHKVSINKHACNDGQFRGITMLFRRDFLRSLYLRDSPKRIIESDIKPFETSVVKLPWTPQLDSLFVSIVPYFDTDIKPSEEMMDLKLHEGVMALLNMDKRFYATLFDFSNPWKIDLLGFMNENYMCDMTIEEFANYTGRSLATFKRDFKKISELPPQKWLIKKRLERAYEMIHEEHRKVTEACFDVGFKNRSHFTAAFKKHYGVSPADIRLDY